jgi:hypothetical protein
MYSAGCYTVFSRVGFPIRRSTGRRLLTAHRRLSQFCHVLHRLLVPRHPPNALTSLTTENLCSPDLAARDAPASGQVMSTFALGVSTLQCMIPDARTRAPSRDVARDFTSHAKSTSSSLRARTSFIYSVVRSAVEDEGIEPSTLGLQSRCSPAELIPQRGRSLKTE